MEEKRVYTKRLLSSQLKQAILLAFKEAKKYGSSSVNSKFLLYAILKIDNTLANKSINNLYRYNSPFNNKVNKILNRCEFEFKILNKKNSLVEKENILTFSRSTRRLLFSITKSTKTNTNISVINTFQVFTSLIRNKSLRKWIKEALID
uniref:Class III stress response-like ATPase n=1 Tax=Nannochloropsis oculata TaxID=43925 RepID=T1RJ61_9STRA|nr:class III stress response-like ATPase [Nannochloropsis oculata]AGI99026.1 class III stress response-like ATPase [Nannochloropsis oculata]AHX25447.1 N-domain of Clp Chaperone [Nannochloropsis oculata]